MPRSLAPLLLMLVASTAAAAGPKPPKPMRGDECVLPRPEPRVRRRPGPPPASLTRADIMAAMARVRGEVEACARLGGDGVVKARVQVAPSGAVARVEIVAAPARRLGACVAVVLRRASFPRTGNGGAFTYPFRF